MKKLVLMAMVAALVVPAMAGETTWTETQSGVIGSYWWNEVNASLTMQIGYADGSPIGNVDYFTRNWYGDSDGQIAHLFLESNQDINVTMSWSGLPSGIFSTRFGVDFLVWDGEGTGAAADAIYEWENYFSGDGSKQFTLNYNGSNLLVLNDGQWWTCSNLGVENSFFDIFGQANNTQGGKLGIGARLDFTPAVTPIPAPGAILLTGIGTTLVGWLRRRRSL